MQVSSNQCSERGGAPAATLVLLCASSLVLLLATAAAGETAAPPEWLQPCPLDDVPGQALCGTYEVFEDREAQSGRKIPLHVLVLKATGDDAKPDPLFLLAGGPGQGATTLAPYLADISLRENRDIVFVDQRGCGQSNPLNCDLPANDDHVQGYLENIFELEAFMRCRDELSELADLRLYTTNIAVDDFDEVCEALGYDQVNLMGTSYGTRAALIFMRRHPDRIRAAVLNGVAPVQFKNPLYHAREAQTALDKIFEACALDEACHAAFPNIAAEFDAVMARLVAEPVRVTIAHPATEEAVEVQLSHSAFAEALRVMMYQDDSSRAVPLLIHEAFLGDFRPFANLGVRRNRGLRRLLSLGMLLSVVCASDVPRISEEEIVRETANTFLGDSRVRTQKAVCDIWPRGEVEEDFGSSVRADIPTVLLSGIYDPVTQPRWGDITAETLPRSLHVVAAAAHGLGGPCIDSILQEFLESGSTADLDTSCVKDIAMPPFDLVDKN